MSERWRNLSTKGKIIQATKIVGSALGVAGIVSACTPIDANAPGVDKSTPPPTDTGHVAPPPTEAPAQIDYFANAEDGISTELQNKVDRYLEANDPNGKLEGGFSVVVDDGNDSTSPVEREFAVTTDGNGDLKIIIDNGQGTRALVPDSITNEGSTSQVDPVSGLPIFIYETNPKNSPADFVLNYYPYLDLGQLPNIKQMPIPIHIPNDSLGNLARKVESPALDPEAWHEVGNVVWQNKNLAPYGKQLVVNTELSGQFGTDVFDLCNKLSYLGALANEFDKIKSNSQMPAGLQFASFENYMAQVIQPSIDTNKTIQGWHLVGHDPLSLKEPYIGMVKPLPDFDPSVCSIRIGANAKVGPNSVVVGDGLQIGMNVIERDGKKIRELVLNVVQTNKNGYGIFYANEKMPIPDLASSYSQMVYTVNKLVDRVATRVPNENSTRLNFASIRSQKTEVGFMYEIPGISNLNDALQWMNEAPSYFVAP